jgi:hypothetical protein
MLRRESAGSAYSSDQGRSSMSAPPKKPQGKIVKVMAPVLKNMYGGGGASAKPAALPRSLVDMTDSADKKWHETWRSGDDPLNLPHPFRVCLTGPPNSGLLHV